MTLSLAVLTVLVGLAAGAAPVSAAALRTGSVDDPVDAHGGLDLASVTVTYDGSAGAVGLRVRLHEPLASDTEAVLDWAMGTGDAAAGCGDTREGLAGLVDLAANTAELTFTEADAEGTPVQHDVPGTLTVAADRRELSVQARSAALAGRDLDCALLWSSDGDDVPAFSLLRSGGPDAVVGQQAGVGPAAKGPPLRVSGPRLSLRRSDGLLVAAVRPTVCAPVGTRLRMVVHETRGAVGTTFRGTRHRHHFVRTQRRPCQRHRMTWRFEDRAAPRYRLVVSIVVTGARG